jgi:nucleoside phosphorylase
VERAGEGVDGQIAVDSRVEDLDRTLQDPTAAHATTFHRHDDLSPVPLRGRCVPTAHVIGSIQPLLQSKINLAIAVRRYRGRLVACTASDATVAGVVTGRVLLLAAVREELGDLAGVAVGVGPVRAAVGAASALEGGTSAWRACVLIGTAGAYRGGPPTGSVVAARRLGLSGGIAEVGLGYAPLHPGPLDTDAGLRASLGLPEVDVLTVEAITTDPGVVVARAACWQVEHMEAYGVALAAQAAGVPFVAVLGISNEVGPWAHSQWRENRGAAEAAARQGVRSWLTREEP